MNRDDLQHLEVPVEISPERLIDAGEAVLCDNAAEFMRSRAEDLRLSPQVRERYYRMRCEFESRRDALLCKLRE